MAHVQTPFLPRFPWMPLLAAAGLALGLACAGGHAGTAAAPTITRFEASAPEVDVGDRVTLAADFRNGKGRVTPAGGPVDPGGTLTVDPLRAGEFTLTVTGPQGTATSRKISVHVRPGLLVDVAGLPEGVTPSITVKAESGAFSATLQGTRALKGLPDGTYTVEAADAASPDGGIVYHPLHPVQKARIQGSGVGVKVVYPSPGLRVDLPEGQAIDFVLIPAGTFTMGQDAPDGGTHDFQPAHRVEIPKAFYMAKFLTTQGQWKAVTKSSPPVTASFRWRTDSDMPVAGVSWNEITTDFVPALARLAPGRAFRLPSEAEWEYCVRAGSTTRYPWGGDFSEASRYIWYLPKGGGTAAEPPRPGNKPANPWGLYDLQGMLQQWVEDTYQPDYTDAPEGSAAWVVPARIGRRCVRGTAFDAAESGNPNPDFDFWASAYRYAKHEGSTHRDLGFRIALDVPEE